MRVTVALLLMVGCAAARSDIAVTGRSAHRRMAHCRWHSPAATAVGASLVRFG